MGEREETSGELREHYPMEKPQLTFLRIAGPLKEATTWEHAELGKGGRGAPLGCPIGQRMG